MCVCVPRECLVLMEGDGSSETGVIEGCELLSEYWEFSPGLLEEFIVL